MPGRLFALALTLGFLAILFVGSAVSPSPEGHGTHQQLGLPPCGWVVAYGKPCMTCGMTTAVSAATHLDAGEALRAQPAGAILALALGTGVWIGAYVAATGSRLGHAVMSLLSRRAGLVGLVVLALGSWGYKLTTWPADRATPATEAAPDPTNEEREST